MSEYDSIKRKQRAFLLQKGISLCGSKINRGYEIYTINRDDNLFKPLAPSIEQQLISGDGGELRSGPNGEPPRFHAGHSSSALVINVAQEFIDNPIVLAAACGLCSHDSPNKLTLHFEKQLKIGPGFSRPANIDLSFTVEGNKEFDIYAIESKFAEPYFSMKSNYLEDKYNPSVNKSLWQGISHLENLAKSLLRSSDVKGSGANCLHQAQLIKHILGLRNRFKNRFKLLYLYYSEPGQADVDHIMELQEFKKNCLKDGINFDYLSYQKLIPSLENLVHLLGGNLEHIDYLKERYL